jgi:hypothetical protein
MSRWRNGWRCASCKVEVSFNTKMNSDGRCPHCGYKSPRACTIMETEEFAIEVKPLNRIIMRGFVKRHRNRIGLACGIVGGALSLWRAPWYVGVAGCILCFVAIGLIEELEFK